MFENKDSQIMQLRALGFPQHEIAERLGISQSAVSQRLENIYRQTRNQDINKVFWNLILGGVSIYLILKLLEGIEKELRR
ncbi:MAG: hypothetical protein KAU24_01420 [Candidatus Aenigmarchaeota archaeon]|nr:hypothetical protein [Candidatus Aenigmarchaeota archaeon]